MSETSWVLLAQQVDALYRDLGDYHRARTEVIAAHAAGDKVARGWPLGDTTGRKETIPAWWWLLPVIYEAPADFIVVEKNGRATRGLIGVTAIDCHNCLTWRETKAGVRIGYRAVESREADPAQAAAQPKTKEMSDKAVRDLIKVYSRTDGRHSLRGLYRYAKDLPVSQRRLRDAAPSELRGRPGNPNCGKK